ncbi:response regulator transcription factor [Acinetobacter sp. MD2(2019)]|uniref:response regulator transcription factor n=1 Tax=Acinetobacter sp. MD2(2019) TaxID=2605273 RepID=UPI002D1F0CB7|nr:response regulator transcription factor [Acinetobacter sp. MD2(2019)]MEB3753642.1 response regulator transcription factor [Acinetobacter sp. MD2(2019)]
MKILIIEDDLDILKNIAEYLELQGYIIDIATDGIQGQTLAEKQSYDLIVMDINLPRLNGFQICQQIKRVSPRQPIIMITARDQLHDKLQGFSMGADDYLIKPFALAELHARILALWNRCYNLAGQHILTVADLQLNRQTYELTRQGKKLKLAPIPLMLLETLMLASPNVVSRSKLEEHLWQDSPPSSDSLRTHIHQIRQIIDKPFPHATGLLQTIHGVGYKLCN